MAMARALARKATGSSPVYEDMEAEAYAVLVEAGRRFDPAFGVNFATFARPRIVGALRHDRRFLTQASRGAGRRVAGVPPTGKGRPRAGPRAGPEPDPPVGHDFEVSEAVALIFRHLPRSQAVACRMLYFEEKSYEDTAQALHCTRGQLCRSHHQTLARLRDNLADALAG